MSFLGSPSRQALRTQTGWDIQKGQEKCLVGGCADDGSVASFCVRWDMLRGRKLDARGTLGALQV